MQRLRLSVAATFGCLVLSSWALADEKQLAIDPYKDNLLVDGDMRFAPVAGKDKDQPRKVFIRTPRYWTLTVDGQKLEGERLPFDTQVKFAGDASVRIKGTGGKAVFSRLGWGDTRDTMRHSWAYTAGVHLKLKDVVGRVYVTVSYSWGKVQSKELTGTTGWTPVSLDFQCDRGTNLLQGIDVLLRPAAKDMSLHLVARERLQRHDEDVNTLLGEEVADESYAQRLPKTSLRCSESPHLLPDPVNRLGVLVKDVNTRRFVSVLDEQIPDTIGDRQMPINVATQSLSTLYCSRRVVRCLVLLANAGRTVAAVTRRAVAQGQVCVEQVHPRAQGPVIVGGIDTGNAGGLHLLYRSHREVQ